jgi:hypothetical protein
LRNWPIRRANQCGDRALCGHSTSLKRVPPPVAGGPLRGYRPGEQPLGSPAGGAEVDDVQDAGHGSTTGP